MIFGGIQKLSTIDFPGVLSCVVFTRGCDLDCFYCHNRELITREGDALSEEEVLGFLQKRVGLLGGVVISGGEPALWPDLPQFVAKVRALGFQVKLDTNGQHPDVVTRLYDEGALDYVAVDVKALPADYASVCGAPGFPEQTVQALLARNADFEARTTLYPGFTIEQLSALFGLFPVLPRWRLNFFRMPAMFKAWDERRLKGHALTKGEIQAALPMLTQIQPNICL